MTDYSSDKYKGINKDNLRLLKRYEMICTNKGLTKETIKAFKCDLLLFFRYIGDKSVEEISHHEVDEFFYMCQEERNNSSQALNRKFTTLNSFYKSLIKKEYLNENVRNPLDRLDKPKVRKKVRNHLTEEEIKIIMDYLEEVKDYRGAALIALLFSSSIRLSEIHQLNRNSLDFDKKQFVVLGKGMKQRKCIFSEDAKIKVLRYLESRDDELEPLFLSRENNRWSKRAIQVFCKKIGEVCNIDKKVHPHIYRHSRAMALLKHDIPIEKISKILGHENLSTTQIYAHSSLDDIQSDIDELDMKF